MKVVFDLRKFSSAHSGRGMGVYVEQLLAGLQRIKKKDFSFQVIKQGPLPVDADLIHYPYFDLFFPTLPFKKPKPAVVTIHDVIPLVFPQHFPRGIKGEVKLQLQELSLRNTAAIITDSESSKEDIITYLHVPAKKIHVVYLAPAKEFKKLPIKEKHNLPERFVLYVGDVNWNKNVDGLLRAVAKTKTNLVFVSRALKKTKVPEAKVILRLIERLGLKEKVKILGWVSSQELVEIYNLATIYVQPSFYEGFGLPVLEAMACGTPVVASAVASLPEICGQAAMMVDPRQLAGAIEKLMKDTQLRKKLSAKGINQAKKFTWQKTAEETIKVYEKVV